MSFHANLEKKILSKISEFTVYRVKMFDTYFYETLMLLKERETNSDLFVHLSYHLVWSSTMHCPCKFSTTTGCIGNFLYEEQNDFSMLWSDEFFLK